MKPPPQSFTASLKHLGPGFIMSAAIVGSGELIATTILGAKAGFVAFWVILVSCFVKVTLQLEFGKNAIYTGMPTMQSINKLDGWRIQKTHIAIWLWLLLQGLKILQVGGIIGGVAIVLHMIIPVVSVNSWAIIAAIVTVLLVYRGYYNSIEKGSLIMIMLFTLSVITSLIALQFTSYAINIEQFKSGLTFSLPPETVAIAMGAFGITGVGGDEIMYYNYWCIEKGYAAYVGPQDDSPEWVWRAKGWIKVMYLDAICSMVIYTTVTAAFYLLGAALLHQKGIIPEGYALVEELSKIFTQTLGHWAKGLFLVGAFFALYSTLFTATASWARIFGDAFGELGWIKFDTQHAQKKAIRNFSWIFPLLWCTLFIFIQLPVMMILLGGIATSILLLIVAWIAVIFRYKQLPPTLIPSKVYDILFWLSVIAILGVSFYGVWQIIK